MEDTERLHDERIIAVREEPNLHIVFYQRDVPDGMRIPWKLLSCVMFLLPQRHFNVVAWTDRLQSSQSLFGWS